MEIRNVTTVGCQVDPLGVSERKGQAAPHGHSSAHVPPGCQPGMVALQLKQYKRMIEVQIIHETAGTNSSKVKI